MINQVFLELRRHPVVDLMISTKGQNAEGQWLLDVDLGHNQNQTVFKIHGLASEEVEYYLYRYAFLATYTDECLLQFKDKEKKLHKKEWEQSERKKYRTAALMQPAVLPWMGYIELVLNSDEFIFLDDFQFSRQNTEHRNRLFLAQDKCDYYTWPINHPGSLDSTYLDVTEHEPNFHRKKFLKTIHYGYAKAPNYKKVYQALEELLSKTHATIADLQYDHLQMVLKLLEVDQKKVRKSSEFSTRHLKRSERVMQIIQDAKINFYYSARGSFGYMEEDRIFPSKNVDVVFQDYEFRDYNQGNRKGMAFMPGLPIIDALFNLSNVEVLDHVRSTTRWKTWNDLMNRKTKEGIE